MERMRQPDSVLRTSEDPSMLVESIIDLGKLIFRVLTVALSDDIAGGSRRQNPRVDGQLPGQNSPP